MNYSTRSVRRLTAIVFGVVLAASFVSDASAAPKAKAGPKTSREIVQEQQDLMLSECKLSDEQQKAIKEKFKLRLDALAKWEMANADKIKAAEEAAKTARQGSDASAKKTATGNLKDLEASRAEATAEADKAMLGVLSDEQKMIWAGVELSQATLPRYKKANLTDDQTFKIKAACTIAAKDLAKFSGDDKKSKQGRTTVEKSLKWAIDNVILTPDQRGTMTPKRAKK